MGSLVTALYVKSDDLLKASPHLAPWRPTVGIALQLTDAELVTLAIMQAIVGLSSEARWLRYARSHLRHLSAPAQAARLQQAAAQGCRTASAGHPAAGHRYLDLAEAVSERADEVVGVGEGGVGLVAASQQ
ncbi:hypothetical protein ACIREM_38635 [Streptomyces shenzhenensis]|uniref:hypothetical protein n=1 Tax=Streptomyces shenzhenensis TaxID=943815 RepID=UPI0037F8373F